MSSSSLEFLSLTPESLTDYLNSLFSTNASLGSIKETLGHLLERLKTKKSQELIEIVIAKLQESASQYESELVTYLLYLSTLQQDSEDWASSARSLIAIPLDRLPASEKLGIYNRIVRLYLEDDDPISAETYHHKMAVFMHDCNDTAMQLQFIAAKARIFDMTKRFYKAAMGYLSVSLKTEIDEQERLEAFDNTLILSQDSK